MGRKIKISEEQYNRLNEMINEDNDVQVAATGDTPQEAATAGIAAAQKIGGADVVISSKPKANPLNTESRVITKQQIKETRKRFLDENSTVYSLDEFRKIVRK